MIAPTTIEELSDVARALGFDLDCRDAIPMGIDTDKVVTQAQYALLRQGKVTFDGTARECAAFLCGWRKLRASVLGAVHALETQVIRWETH